MDQSKAQRRLVKSPPELWAQLSSEDSLGRHLAEFGEIRITRVEPETTVAWEGDRASGTVQIAPTGWGTQVTLTATAVAQPEAVQTAREPELQAIEPVAPAQPAAPEPDHAPRGFFARLFRRQAAIPPPPAPGPDPSPPTPGPDPMPPVPGPDPSPPAPGPDPGPPDPGPGPGPPQIRQPREPALALDPQRTETILSEVLDVLGAAHHRPFTRG